MGNVRIPVQNLFGGVARQPASKRLASELEEIDNAILTLERSAEKRPPLEFVHGGGTGGLVEGLGNEDTIASDDMAYFFFDKTDNNRLIELWYMEVLI
jgi:hypothetical protein